MTAEGDQKMLCSEQLEANCGTVDLCVTIFAELEGDFNPPPGDVLIIIARVVFHCREVVGGPAR